MKTQINQLVKGDHRKSIVGTNSEIRQAVALKVRFENPEIMQIMLRGNLINLEANWSVSGKSVTYNSQIQLSLYREFFGDFGMPNDEPKAYITIFSDCTVALSTNSKKSFYNYIPESEITIK